MNNLNKAFIQAYKKTGRISKPAHGPHFAMEERESPQAVAAKPMEVASPSPSPSATHYRVDSSASMEHQLQPWFTSVSTIGLEAYSLPESPAPSVRPIAPSTPSIEPNKPLAKPTFSDVPGPSESNQQQSNLKNVRLDGPHLPGDVPVGAESNTKRQSLSAYLKLARGFDGSADRLDAEAMAQAVIQEQQPSQRLKSTTIKSSPDKYFDRYSSAASPIAVEEIDPAQIEPKIVDSSILDTSIDDRSSMDRSARQEVAHLETQFHAVWEVDSFQWPSVIQRLSSHEPSVFAEVGRHIKRACQTGLRVMAVTSASAGQGRTTVACCIARSAARAGMKVALVDGDLHHPELADQLNLETVHGWEEVVASDLPLEEAAIHSLEDKITLIPLASSSQTTPLAPDHPKVQRVLRRLAASFDLVVIDSQHLAHPSGRIMGGGIDTPIDAAVLVVDMNFPDEQMNLESIRRLSRIGIESVGLVENFQ